METVAEQAKTSRAVGEAASRFSRISCFTPVRRYTDKP